MGWREYYTLVCICYISVLLSNRVHLLLTQHIHFFPKSLSDQSFFEQDDDIWCYSYIRLQVLDFNFMSLKKSSVLALC